MSAPAPPKVVFTQIEPSTATTADDVGSGRNLIPVVAMIAGVLVIAGALVFLMLRRGPDFEVIDLATAFACPAGTESRRDRMLVTASTLNVRAAPSTSADRLLDRTLRNKAAVTEECRAGDWSRVRLVDGRSGWVANQYLAPNTQKH
jgi:uncharacterized protein YgiM (DUF1202 family)